MKVTPRFQAPMQISESFCTNIEQTKGFFLLLAQLKKDCWLYLDGLLDGKLLARAVDKKVQAGEEAARTKKLMSSLRYLYRNSALLAT